MDDIKLCYRSILGKVFPEILFGCLKKTKKLIRSANKDFKKDRDMTDEVLGWKLLTVPLSATGKNAI